VKLPAVWAEMRGAVSPVSAEVLQVTPEMVTPAFGWMNSSEVAVIAVELITQVPVDALVAQEICPPSAAPHATADGLADDPAAEQLA